MEATVETASDANALRRREPEQRGLAASLRAPFRRLEQFHVRILITSSKNFTPVWPNEATLTFAWGKGARWLYAGSRLALWRWNESELVILDLRDGRVRRTSWRNSHEGQALAFLFDDFAEDYELQRTDVDQRHGGGLLVRARGRALPRTAFQNIELRRAANKETVHQISLVGLQRVHTTGEDIALIFSLSDPEAAPRSPATPLPESCFAIQTAVDAKESSSPCPVDAVAR